MSRQRRAQLMMNKLTLAHCLKQVQHKEQVMVFVHSRKETAGTMHSIIGRARGNEDEPGTLDAFLPPQELQIPISLQDRIQRSRNKELEELLEYGMGIHHAGMRRSDRKLTEQLFGLGYIRVLCCTTTLAWESTCRHIRSLSRALNCIMPTRAYAMVKLQIQGHFVDVNLVQGSSPPWA